MSLHWRGRPVIDPPTVADVELGQRPLVPAADPAPVDEQQQAGGSPPGRQHTASSSSIKGSDDPAGKEAAEDNAAVGGGTAGPDDTGAGRDQQQQEPPAQEREEEPTVRSATYLEVSREFFVLGWTAFGGPAAHIGMFQQRFVEVRRWVTVSVFTELLMLSQVGAGRVSGQRGRAVLLRLGRECAAAAPAAAPAPAAATPVCPHHCPHLSLPPGPCWPS